MIGAFEQHVAHYLADRLSDRAAGNPLFRAVRPIPGTFDPARLEPGETGLSVLVDALDLLQEEQQVGMATVDRPRDLRLGARVSMHLLGPVSEVGASAEVELEPPSARFAGVDLDLLLLLQELEPRLAPGADVTPPVEPPQDRLRSWVIARSSGRQVALRWERFELSEISRDERDELTGWLIELEAELAFRLEPTEEAGVITGIRLESEPQRKPLGTISIGSSTQRASEPDDGL
ncbi:MAG: hypothetical protein AAF560_23190 [Acidobacteriota bacterium]